MDLKVLFVEDSPDDAELMLRRLRDAGYEPQWDRVQAAATLRDALAGERWQVALVDYNMPGFGGIDALKLLAELAPDLPAITVSGDISEETAVETLGAGAMDYVLKHNLTRLAPAVTRAVEGADLRRQHREAAESARLALNALDRASLSVVTTAPDGTIVYVNDLACKTFAADREELVGAKLWEYDRAARPETWADEWDKAVRDGVYEFRIDRIDRIGAEGRRFVMDVTANYLESTDQMVSYGRDVTDRVIAEEQARQSEEQFEQFAQRIPGIVTIKDAGHRYVYASVRSGSADGVADSASWEGETPLDIWARAEAEHSEEVADRTLAGEVVDEVMEWQRKGETRYFHCVHFPLPQHDGPPLVGGISLDVTGQMLAEQEVRRKAEQLRRTVEGTVLAMGHVVESRDPYTAGHERRVAELAEAICAALGMNDEEVDGVRLAGLIHDIGKIAVPAEILSKPGRLSVVEFNLIKQHARAGYEIIEAVEFSEPVADMVLQHHERLDGSGYPQGLTEAQILPQAKILAVADVAEAMSSHRPYRPALGMDAALDELKEGAGVKYDAGVVTACVKLVEEGFSFTP